MARNTQGKIPDDHFENEPSGPAKNISPPSQSWKDHMAALKADEDKDEGDELATLRDQ